LAFAISSAQRVNPIINEYATDETKKMFREQIELLWKLFWEGNFDVSFLMDELESRPEYSEDNSLSPLYYTMRALGVIFYSIRVAEGFEIIDNIIYTSTSMLNICSDIDSFALDFGHKGTITLEQLEIEIQTEILDIIKLNDKKEVFQKIQDKNATYIKLLNELLPYIDKGNGWN